MNQQYHGLFENWEIGVATKVVREFKTQWKCLQVVDEEDLLQECLTHWIFSKDKFDPEAGAKRNTFMARIVSRKLMDIVRKQSSDKRKVAYHSSSIDQPLNNDEENSSLLEVLASDVDSKAQIELRFALERALPLLTASQRELCEFLQAGEVRIEDLATKMGVERTTIYREIRRIRKVFEDEGLKTFLK